jgi:hypothetical protein
VPPFRAAGGLPDPGWLIQVLPEITFPDGCARLTRRPSPYSAADGRRAFDHLVQHVFFPENCSR